MGTLCIVLGAVLAVSFFVFLYLMKHDHVNIRFKFLKAEASIELGTPDDRRGDGGRESDDERRQRPLPTRDPLAP